ncbi:helix-turn-helix domain-containing protein [Paenibacillus cisolokensis]|uniref:helix-turn-helix domain-containing protein n=1 Tax=Paenibacillus cisolokensis TaxID=1658519 RepID=UPI001BCD8D6D
MLSASDDKIVWIAEQCGFESLPHFHRCFKKHVGMTPAKYRILRGVSRQLAGAEAAVPRRHAAAWRYGGASAQRYAAAWRCGSASAQRYAAAPLTASARGPRHRQPCRYCFSTARMSALMPSSSGMATGLSANR